MSRHVPPPKTVCPECGQRSERADIRRVWADDLRSKYLSLLECPKCHRKSRAGFWKHYTPEGRKANGARAEALDKAYREAHKEQARERKARWYECNGDLVRASRRRRYESDTEYRAALLKRQRERRYDEG